MTLPQELTRFFLDVVRSMLSGSIRYWAWLGVLGVALVPGAIAWIGQVQDGLVVTGLSDQVTWGSYIANFTYLVGLAAASVMLVIPAYLFHNPHAERAVILGEGAAVAACTMALLFVMVDLGRPDRFWHLIPIIGLMNFPDSVMSWDVIALGGYLALNIAIPALLLFRKWSGREAHGRFFGVAVVVTILWAISIHTVTAFLFSANTGRTFWHTALLGPRFLASAFAAGPAFILIALAIIDRVSAFSVPGQLYKLLSRIVGIALLINLFMLFSEAFTELYAPTSHSASFHYLLLGHEGHTGLVIPMRIALVMEVIAAGILVSEKLRSRKVPLLLACALCAIGVWIEKGIGLIIPGFIPTAIGEVLEYFPTSTELLISMSIWAFGILLFTLLAKIAIDVDLGVIRRRDPVPTS